MGTWAEAGSWLEAVKTPARRDEEDFSWDGSVGKGDKFQDLRFVFKIG